VAIGLDLARNEGVMGADGRIRDQDGLARLTNAKMRHMRAGFDKVFNPDIDDCDWALYEFPPCCNYHMSLALRPLPDDWTGKTRDELRDLLPDGWGVAVVERLRGEPPHAEIGGTCTHLDSGAVSSHHVAHEIGHLF
jgi:hypothetical protein